MLKIKFANNTEVEYIEAFETEEFFSGASRRTLTVYCAENAIGVDALHNVIKNEANTAAIIMGDENVQNNYSGYVLELACGINPVLVTPQTPEAPAVYENRIVFKLGKRTYIEQALKNLGL